MARALILAYDGAVSRFGFSKVDRSKLYGVRKRIPLDPDGRPARRGALTYDGSMVIQQGMTAQGYFDEDNRWWPVGDLVGLDADGNEAEKHQSTLGREVELEGPLPATGLLDLRVQSVYALEPEDEDALDPGLKAKLDEGALFRFPFVYRSGYKQDEAWLVANDTGVYAITGRPADAPWSELTRAVDPADLDEEDDLDDELDFEMF